MAYNHGVRVSEQATSIISPTVVEASIPLFIGCAPVHKITAGKTGSVNKAELCYTYAAAMALFGYDADWDKYSLSMAMYVQFVLFGVAPAFFINIFDPSKHRTTVSGESVIIGADGTGKTANSGLLAAPVVKNADGTVTYTEATDYDVDLISGTISRITTGTISVNDVLAVDYVYGDPTLVTADDIIGAVDATTGKKSGLQLIDTCFPTSGLLPMSVAMPGFSQHNDVVVAALAQATNINSHFKALVIADIDDTVAIKPTDVSGYKNDNNLVDPDLLTCWGRLSLSSKKYYQSVQLACLMQSVAADNDGVPYESPSNKNYQMDALIVNGEELYLGIDEANYLNSQGVITALNFSGGWKCWGNQTSAYPSNTDIKDCTIVGRNMFHWFSTEVILTYWQKVDKPMTKRLIETILDSLNYRLSALSARQYILGGRVEFNSDENNVTDMMAGSLLFHLYFTFPGAAQDMHFVMEYDASYLSALFA